MFSITALALRRFWAVLLCSNLAAFLAQPGLASGCGWVLTQRSKELGDQYVYLSPNGVKCINPRRGLGLVAKAPSWNVSFYNDKTRLYYSLTFASWRAKLEAQSKVPANVTWHKWQPGNIAGLKATKYTASNPSAKPGRNAWISADCWLADQIRVPPQLAELLASTYNLPTTQKVPLRVTYSDGKGKSETILDTYRQETAPLPDSYLTIPYGYRLARSEVEVMITEENRQLVDDIARDLGQEPGSLSNKGATASAASNLPSRTAIENALPSNGLTLPNGKKIGRGEIDKFIDAYKQYRQDNGR